MAATSKRAKNHVTGKRKGPAPAKRDGARALLLWQRLDLIRVREGLSDSQFAALLGMSRQQYSNLKTNRQRITTAWRIALEAMEAHGTSFISPVGINRSRNT